MRSPAAPPSLLRLALAGAFLAAFLLVPAAGAQIEVRTLEQSFFPAETESVHIGLAFGDLRLEGTDGRNVEVEMVILCNQDTEKCRARAAKLELAPRIGSRKFKLGLRNTSRAMIHGIEARMIVRLPRALPVDVDLRVGDVSVTGLASDLEIDSGGGDVDVVYQRDLVGQVDVNVTVGSANLWVQGGQIKGTGFPKSLNWQGSGNAAIEVDMASGQAEIRLE